MNDRPVIYVHNPATLEEVGKVECAFPKDVPVLVEGAREAQRQWAALPLVERARTLKRVQGALVEQSDQVAELVSRETGKPIMEAFATDVMNALSVGDFAIYRMKCHFRQERIDLGHLSLMMRYLGRFSRLVPRPIGVVGVISPWNYPLAIPYAQSMMCLAAGNGVVIKPSSRTPLTVLRMREIMEGAGLPAGLVQVAIGPGKEVGEALASSAVDRIIFTGNSQVGRRIMSLAAQRLTPITLELGGKDAFIILPDADLERAARAACWGSFVNCGQTCAAIKRIYVHRSVQEEFTDLLLKEVRSLRQGYDAKDPSISVGSMISSEAVKDMEEQLARAVGQGANVLIGGGRPEGLAGHFFQPTLLNNVTQGMDIVHEETFGPLVALISTESAEEAVNWANDNRFALGGSLWTADLKRGKELVGNLRSGTVVINNVAYTYGLGSVPWGGRGESGLGRTNGDLGFQELLERQHVHVDRGRFPSEVWWHPYGRESVEAMRDFTILAFGGERRGILTKFLRARRLLRR